MSFFVISCRLWMVRINLWFGLPCGNGIFYGVARIGKKRSNKHFLGEEYFIVSWREMWWNTTKIKGAVSCTCDTTPFICDSLGGGTLYFLSLIISYLSCCLSFSPPISPRLNFFVLHWYTTLCQYCKDTDFCFENQRKFQEMFNGMLPVCFSQEVLLYQIPDIKFYLQSDNRIRFHYFYILVKCVLIL